MKVWVVNFFLPNGYTHKLQFYFTRVYKTKEALLLSLKFMGFEMNQIRFEKQTGREDGEDYYIRYYPLEDNRTISGELQCVSE